MRRRAWLVYLSCGVATLLAYLFVPGLRQGWLFNLIAVSSPIAILIAVRTWRPEEPTPWYLFALGLACFVAGDVIAYNYELFFMRELPFPSSADVLYLSVYPCLIAGILLLVRRRNPGRDRDSVIDSLIVAIGVGVISWAFLMEPAAQDAGSSLVEKVVGVSYPFMDLFLLTAVVRLVMGPGRRGLSFYLLPAAALCLFVTDFASSYDSVRGVLYDRSGYLELGTGMFYLLWGAAALHWSQRQLAERAPIQEVRITRSRLMLLCAAMLVPQAVREIQQLLGHDANLWIITISTTLLFVLAISRMAGLVEKLKLSFGREKALRTAGASFVTATNRDEIYGATMQAVTTLAPLGRARLLVPRAPGDEAGFAIIAASDGPVGLLGTSVDLPWDELGGAEAPASRVFQGPMPELVGALRLPVGTGWILAIPLVTRDELSALLVVGSDEELSNAAADGLRALASQVALALESAALTEGLHRRQSEARFATLVQHSSDVVMVVDADSRIRYVSPSVERVLGYPASEVEGTRLVDSVHPEDRANLLQFLTMNVGDAEAHPVLTEYRLRHRGSHWLSVETLRTNLLNDENVRGIVLNTRDVSERKAFEEQLAHQAFHDPITGLANRALFRDRVEHALERLGRDERAVTVLFMDVDDFKTINDSLGHAAGDRLLSEVGERIKATLRAADTAARLGGDEFAILLEDGGHGIEAAEVASRILAALQAPLHLEDKEVFLRASIGIASADEPRVDRSAAAEELLRNADVAMYMAKEAGKARYQIFEPAMHDTALKRLELKADLQRAVDNEELVLHYQPVIELETGRIEGFEALVRWEHPVRGMVPPLDFIPLAEETGLIVPIGNWVLREACRRAIELQERFPTDPPLHMAVNLSARQLQRPEVVSDVGLALMETGLEPSHLVLEITESVMMQDVELSTQRLTELKELGVKLAVDDFGTGYSSLNYIRRFPVDILKVDKSFVDGVTGGGEESALAAAIIELASILRLRPVAEGIERADQLEKLLALSCDLGQGYYFARPLPPDAVDELLTARRSLAERESELTS
jgi:diguanylate cyclase (GGDEF)-like protein/PAS domain S-box-containing protein